MIHISPTFYWTKLDYLVLYNVILIYPIGEFKHSKPIETTLFN